MLDCARVAGCSTAPVPGFTRCGVACEARTGTETGTGGRERVGDGNESTAGETVAGDAKEDAEFIFAAEGSEMGEITLCG